MNSSFRPARGRRCLPRHQPGSHCAEPLDAADEVVVTATRFE